MRNAYAHTADLVVGASADDRAPGGAITLALCGSWEHDGPCPLAPHHTAVERVGPVLHVRTLFAAAPDDEPRVRTLIGEALGSGALDGPDGRTSSWTLVREGADDVRDDERDHAERLAQQD
ncbi:hypothetical protein [Angustibacter peucedani]